MKAIGRHHLRVGDVIHTMTLGRVKVKELVGDEVHCQVVNGKAQLVLSQRAALRRNIETAKDAKK